jgi:SAM-dependent methyltransferase
MSIIRDALPQKSGPEFRIGAIAAAAFDKIAASYDRDFTDSLIGRAQRQSVWSVALRTFRPNDNVLELNCGTGEDAFFLAEHGMSVFACDTSPQMIARAEQRLSQKSPLPPVIFCHLPSERIDELDPALRFNGVFSNFSGLNCIADLSALASSLSNLVERGGPLLLCFSTRVCLIEIIYYLLRRQRQKSIRRLKGKTEAMVNGASLTVYYPTQHEIRRSFAPHFRFRFCRGIGVAVPPSYLEPFVRRHPGVFRVLCRLEEFFAPLPIFRSTGDHILLCFERVPQ